MVIVVYIHLYFTSLRRHYTTAAGEKGTNMNDLQIFVYSGEQLRTVQRDDGLWWVLRDVCRVLNIGNVTDTKKRLDPDEVDLTDLIDGMGRVQSTTIINEPGLYSVILRSDKPEAKQFKRWVTHDVLPSIRKTGAYGIPPEQVARITALQKRLDEWRSLTDEMERLTADACQKARVFREHYDKLREQRDRCRRNLRAVEQALTDEIRNLKEVI